MVFQPPSWVPQLPNDPPDSIPIAEFMRNEKYGRHPVSKSRHPFTCGVSGKSYSFPELFDRAEYLSRTLAQKLFWNPNEDTPWDKVACIFSLNALDYITTAYAVHRLSGIVTPANASSSALELQHQLVTAGAKVLFTCAPLLDIALKAAVEAGISQDKIFLLSIPGNYRHSRDFLSIDDLILEGINLPDLEPLRWSNGQGARQPAFLCYSSGTSGLPKAVMISHRNVISNVLQLVTFESISRKKRGIETCNVNGFLPMSHIYGLVVVSHVCTWRGDGVIILPKYDFESFLNSIQTYRIQQLIVVPPVIIQILSKQEVCKRYDLSSVRWVMSGAAPLGEETINNLKAIYPGWNIAQAYGMTETSTVVTWTSEDDVMIGSAGSLIPGARLKLMNTDGEEVTQHNSPGEVYVQAPSVVLGYLNNEKATSETFVHHNDGRWIRTGDEGIMTVAPSGYEHLVIVDRIKELIKVKGHQVAPAELEAHILAHPAVSDCAVIQVPDERSGEVPKAFVVKASEVSGQSEKDVAMAIIQHVEKHKASYKQLRGGVEFLEIIPKSPSGKILRRLLREREKAKRQASKL